MSAARVAAEHAAALAWARSNDYARATAILLHDGNDDAARHTAGRSVACVEWWREACQQVRDVRRLEDAARMVAR